MFKHNALEFQFGGEAVNASPQTASQAAKPVEESLPVLAALDTAEPVSLQQDKAVVVECGPVEYAHEAAAHDDDYDEEEEDEDISTAQLMMHGYGEGKPLPRIYSLACVIHSL